MPGTRSAQGDPRPSRPRGDAPPVRRLRWLLPALLVVVWLGLGGSLGPLGGQLSEVADSGAAAYLPKGAESSEVVALDTRFAGTQMLPAIVVYEREGGLSDADRAAIQRATEEIGRELADDLAAAPVGPVPSADGAAVQVVVPFSGSDINALRPAVERLRNLVDGVEGVPAYVTGPAGTELDLVGALGAIDLMLVLVTSGLIVLILIVVYRSPILPFAVLFVAGTALGVTQGVIYLLGRFELLTMGAEVQGILNVLVLGAGTDYALLLVARYREELRRHESRHDAIWVAWRASVGPIVASAGTVALGLLCLLVSDLGLNRDLGPVGAIGIGCALLAMLTFMPAVLVLLGRAAFWPFRPTWVPALAGAPVAPVAGRGIWSLVTRSVDRRPRLIWTLTAAVLGVLAIGIVRLDADGIPQSEMLIADDVESKVGQQVLAEHFPAGAGNPAIVIARAGRLPAVAAAAAAVPGVEDVAPFTGGPPAEPQAPPKVVDGLARIDVTLADAPDSDAAAATVERLRAAVHAVPGADAKVGGYTAVELDFDAAAERDRIVIPLLLAVVLVVLVLLLRSLVAPVLLLATVVLSFLAAMGVSAVVFQDVLGFPGADSTYPLHAFVFLVALGVDYNIFLMTRVREEAQRIGPRPGVLAGLALTGGVITSAGVVLAATFSALALIPLVLLVELAFTVAFGVLLDTLVVRSLLVPALAVDLGRWVWWPGRLSQATPTAPPPDSNDERSAEVWAAAPAGSAATSAPVAAGETPGPSA